MKRLVCAWFALLFGLVFDARARAEIVADGTVGCGQAIVQYAAAGGALNDVSVEVGSFVQTGDTVATLTSKRVYAPCDGTVEAVFAFEGHSASEATNRYGGALSIAPENRYMIYASTKYAYESLRTTNAFVGETVYMCCTADGTHRGTGTVTKIDGETLYIEATGGAFYNGETVYIYMEDDYENTDKLGKGTVVARTGEMVSAEGEVLRLWVNPGDFVEKGQLLFETLTALPDDQQADALTLIASSEGYVAAVYAEEGSDIEKDAPLLAICPQERLTVTVQVSEMDINSLRIGDSCMIRVELSENTLEVPGSIQAISFLPVVQEDGSVFFEATIQPNDTTGMIPGMTAAVRFT